MVYKKILFGDILFIMNILEQISSYNNITIQCHDNPDADAIASGLALFDYLVSLHDAGDQAALGGRKIRLIYSGLNRISKSNIKLMLEKLDIPLEFENPGQKTAGLLVTVDCQYGAGNVTKLEADNIAIIDHHQPISDDCPYPNDIRSDYGSCSTVLWKLLSDTGYDVNSDIRLSTALYYGLFTDTSSLTEMYSPVDRDMYDYLEFDAAIIRTMCNSNISLKELEIAGMSLIRTIYNESRRFAIVRADNCDPNILGLINDICLQVDTIDTSLVFSEITDGIKFSIRSCIREVQASELAGFIADDIGNGGGHYDKAGGMINPDKLSVKYPDENLESYFSNRFQLYFNSYDLIYADNFRFSEDNFKRYARKKIPKAVVILSDIYTPGSTVTIRTAKGDMNINVSRDVYILLNITGSVELISKKDFEENYIEAPYSFHMTASYAPTIRIQDHIRHLEHNKPLEFYGHPCIPKFETMIYARKLRKNVKLFPHDQNSAYMTGHVDDYLAVKPEDPSEPYIIEKDLFDDLYHRILI